MVFAAGGMLVLIGVRCLLLSALYCAVIPGVAKYGHSAGTKRNQGTNTDPGGQEQLVEVEGVFTSEPGGSS